MRAAFAAAVALAAAAFVLSVAPAGACACGIALEASVVEERAIVAESRFGETIVAEFDLSSDGPRPAAVVIPVPADPMVSAVRGDPIGYLDAATTPPPPELEGTTEDGAPAVGSGVDVVDRDVIGGYDVTILSARDPGALGRYLADNGYTLPAGARPILSDYVEERWSFVAIKLAEGAEGSLKPLRIDFSTARLTEGELVYPMKLSQLAGEPVGLTLYVIADGPRSVDGLERTFDAPLAELDPAPPEEVELIAQLGSHVSRLEAAALDPGSLSEDLVVEADAVADPGGHSFFGGLVYLLSLIF